MDEDVFTTLTPLELRETAVIPNKIHQCRIEVVKPKDGKFTTTKNESKHTKNEAKVDLNNVNKKIPAESISGIKRIILNRDILKQFSISANVEQQSVTLKPIIMTAIQSKLKSEQTDIEKVPVVEKETVIQKAELKESTEKNCPLHTSDSTNQSKSSNSFPSIENKSLSKNANVIKQIPNALTNKKCTPTIQEIINSMLNTIPIKKKKTSKIYTRSLDIGRTRNRNKKISNEKPMLRKHTTKITSRDKQKSILGENKDGVTKTIKKISSNNVRNRIRTGQHKKNSKKNNSESLEPKTLAASVDASESFINEKTDFHNEAEILKHQQQTTNQTRTNVNNTLKLNQGVTVPTLSQPIKDHSKLLEFCKAVIKRHQDVNFIQNKTITNICDREKTNINPTSMMPDMEPNINEINAKPNYALNDIQKDSSDKSTSVELTYICNNKDDKINHGKKQNSAKRKVLPDLIKIKNLVNCKSLKTKTVTARQKSKDESIFNTSNQVNNASEVKLTQLHLENEILHFQNSSTTNIANSVSEKRCVVQTNTYKDREQVNSLLESNKLIKNTNEYNDPILVNSNITQINPIKYVSKSPEHISCQVKLKDLEITKAKNVSEQIFGNHEKIESRRSIKDNLSFCNSRTGIGLKTPKSKVRSISKYQLYKSKNLVLTSPKKIIRNTKQIDTQFDPYEYKDNLSPSLEKPRIRSNVKNNQILSNLGISQTNIVSATKTDINSKHSRSQDLEVMKIANISDPVYLKTNESSFDQSDFSMDQNKRSVSLRNKKLGKVVNKINQKAMARSLITSKTSVTKSESQMNELKKLNVTSPGNISNLSNSILSNSKALESGHVAATLQEQTSRTTSKELMNLVVVDSSSHAKSSRKIEGHGAKGKTVLSISKTIISPSAKTDIKAKHIGSQDLELMKVGNIPNPVCFKTMEHFDQSDSCENPNKPNLLLGNTEHRKNIHDVHQKVKTKANDNFYKSLNIDKTNTTQTKSNMNNLTTNTDDISKSILNNSDATENGPVSLTLKQKNRNSKKEILNLGVEDLSTQSNAPKNDNIQIDPKKTGSFEVKKCNKTPTSKTSIHLSSINKEYRKDAFEVNQKVENINNNNFNTKPVHLKAMDQSYGQADNHKDQNQPCLSLQNKHYTSDINKVQQKAGTHANTRPISNSLSIGKTSSNIIVAEPDDILKSTASNSETAENDRVNLTIQKPNSSKEISNLVVGNSTYQTKASKYEKKSPKNQVEHKKSGDLKLSKLKGKLKSDLSIIKKSKNSFNQTGTCKNALQLKIRNVTKKIANPILDDLSFSKSGKQMNCLYSSDNIGVQKSDDVSKSTLNNNVEAENNNNQTGSRNVICETTTPISEPIPSNNKTTKISDMQADVFKVKEKVDQSEAIENILDQRLSNNQAEIHNNQSDLLKCNKDFSAPFTKPDVRSQPISENLNIMPANVTKNSKRTDISKVKKTEPQSLGEKIYNNSTSTKKTNNLIVDNFSSKTTANKNVNTFPEIDLDKSKSLDIIKLSISKLVTSINDKISGNVEEEQELGSLALRNLRPRKSANQSSNPVSEDKQVSLENEVGKSITLKASESKDIFKPIINNNKKAKNSKITVGKGKEKIISLSKNHKSLDNTGLFLNNTKIDKTNDTESGNTQLNQSQNLEVTNIGTSEPTPTNNKKTVKGKSKSCKNKERLYLSLRKQARKNRKFNKPILANSTSEPLFKESQDICDLVLNNIKTIQNKSNQTIGPNRKYKLNQSLKRLQTRKTGSRSNVSKIGKIKFNKPVLAHSKKTNKHLTKELQDVCDLVLNNIKTIQNRSEQTSALKRKNKLNLSLKRLQTRKTASHPCVTKNGKSCSKIKDISKSILSKEKVKTYCIQIDVDKDQQQKLEGRGNNECGNLVVHDTKQTINTEVPKTHEELVNHVQEEDKSDIISMTIENVIKEAALLLDSEDLNPQNHLNIGAANNICDKSKNDLINTTIESVIQTSTLYFDNKYLSGKNVNNNEYTFPHPNKRNVERTLNLTKKVISKRIGNKKDIFSDDITITIPSGTDKQPIKTQDICMKLLMVRLNPIQKPLLNKLMKSMPQKYKKRKRVSPFDVPKRKVLKAGVKKQAKEVWKLPEIIENKETKPSPEIIASKEEYKDGPHSKGPPKTKRVKGEDLRPYFVDGLYRCSDCPYTAKIKSYLKDHLIAHKRKEEVYLFKCDLCPMFESKYRSAYNVHMARHRLENSASKKILKCDARGCNYQTLDKYLFKKHVITHMALDVLPKFECHICQFKTKYKISIEKHVLTHRRPEEITMYKCDTCTYQSKYKDSLHFHQKMVHGEKNQLQLFKCDKCSYKTYRKHHLKRHLPFHSKLGANDKFAVKVKKDSKVEVP